MTPIGIWVPGDSPLHRMPPGAKLLGLALCAIGVVAFGSPLVIGLAAVGIVGLFALARIRPGVAFTQIRPVLWFAVPLFGLQLWLAGPRRAVEIVGGLVLVVALAALVTLTTRVADMLSTIERLLGPLRRFGVDPTRVGLVLALAVRCVPLVAQTYHQVREAQRARGLERSPRALAVPLVIRLLKRADRMGEALSARGLDD